jgi:L-alanine-DL-glutamate epimerase-like enolase superfamily enzyme
MRIEQIDFFYVSMPVIEDRADGSQDALVVRVQGDGQTGWGECEASPLVSIAAFVAPMSHSACRPVRDSLMGETVNSVDDIRCLSAKVAANSFDMLQTPHTLSGIEIALCDALARQKKMPVYKMLGHEKKYPKLAYASMLFAPTPEETGRHAREAAEQGYRAVKFGWGGFGVNLEHDRALVEAIRKAIGSDVRLMVDVGTLWSNKTDEAIKRVQMLEEFDVVWLEEPFESMEYPHYAELSRHCKKLKIAAGEGSHSAAMAKNMIDHGKVAFIQIDTGRVGGILPAHDLAEYALKKGVQFVNHTFTTPLALSASLQPMIGIEKFDICEFPVQPTQLAQDINRPLCVTDRNGMFDLPDGDGLAIEVDLAALKKYLVQVKIESHGKVLYESPKI